MDPSSSSAVITALKGRTQLRFQPSPPDTTSAMAPSPSFAMTSTWQHRLPSWTSVVTAAAEEEAGRDGKRAFRPPERTESQKYDAWKDIFQRSEQYQNTVRKVQGEEEKADEDASIGLVENGDGDGDDEYEYYYEYYYETEEEEEEEEEEVDAQEKVDAAAAAAAAPRREAIIYNKLVGRSKSNGHDERRHRHRRLQPHQQHRRRHQRHQIASRRNDAPNYDYGEEEGGALFNDVRRDDGGSAAISLQSLANKDYGSIKNKSGRRGVTARIADAVKNPAFAATFVALAIPTLIAGGYYLYTENGPTPVIHARAAAAEGDSADPGHPSKVASALTRAIFQALLGTGGDDEILY